MALTIYVPSNKEDSKCWKIFNPILVGWPDVEIVNDYVKRNTPGMVWGFVGRNESIVKQYINDKINDWFFSDMPYFGRWTSYDESIDPKSDFYWRIIKNKIHADNVLKHYPDDRWKAHNIDLKDWNFKGKHILVCPSSSTMTRFTTGMTDDSWLETTLNKLSTLTDRPIKVRFKPRGKGRSGPDVALIPFSEDLKNAHAVVTSVSMCAVEAIIEGIPAFCHTASPAAPMGNTYLNNIENPSYLDRQDWLNYLSYNQFTSAEIASGMAYEILNK